MGFLEPHVGYRRGDGETRLKPVGKAITVISFAQAEAALAAAAALKLPVTLISAPDAAASVGPGWFDALVALARAEYPDVEVTAILDCGAAPGRALAALRHGLKAIRYDGPSVERIADIARRSGARLVGERPPSLDLEAALGGDIDTESVCRAWLESDK